MEKGIDLIIFDFDGTLAHSISIAIRAVRDMLAELNLPVKSEAEIDEFVGHGEWPLIEGSTGSSDPVLLKEAMESYRKHYINTHIHDTPLYPKVKETLAKMTNKIKIIASNKKDEFIKVILKNHNLDHHFPQVFGGDAMKHLKPDPTLVHELRQEYNVPAEKTLFVGDMTIDVKTGQNADVKTCAVTYGFDSREKLKALNPDYLIDDFSELLEIIN